VTERPAYLRAHAIAARLGLSERTVRRRIADRTFASVKIGGARLMSEVELERLLSEGNELESPPDEDDQESASL
jgi:excisionase family DNA binding protein